MLISPFADNTKMGEKNINIDTIDVMTSNDYGKIIDMKVCYNPEYMMEL